MTEQTTVNDDDIKRVEADLAAKKAADDKAKQEEISKLLESAATKGKDEALKEFQAEQARKEAEARAAKLEEDMKRLKEESEKKVTELAKQMETKLQELDSQRKGVVRSDSPFNKTTPNSTPQLTKEKMDEIDRRSMEAFYSYLGRPVPPQ